VAIRNPQSGADMFDTTPTLSSIESPDFIESAPAAVSRAPSKRIKGDVSAALRLVKDHLVFQRRMIRTNDVIYRAGEPFKNLYILNSGLVKLVNLSIDGRDQVVSLKFRGDWLGFDGIADEYHNCDAVALDTGEVWIVRYSAVLAACARAPHLMGCLHTAMSRAITGERDCLMSVCTLPADARVADFLRYWAESLADRGMRYDQISLRMTRGEIGNYLGITLETVSRALSKLARANIIAFNERGRREICIPDLGALALFVQDSLPQVFTARASRQ
jgi:CRP/FNR family transcriptional regulator